MHIRRTRTGFSRSGLAYRRQRRPYGRRPNGGGCLPLTVVFGVIVGLLITSWGWIEERLNPEPTATPVANLNAALSAFSSGDLDTSIQAATRIYDEDTTRTDALMLLVRSLVYRSYSDYNSSSDRETALRIARDAFDQQPFESNTLAAYGFALQANGNPAEAFQLAERALQLEPSHPLARTVIALSYAGVGSFDKALQASEAALQAPGEWRLDALRAKAISLSDLGRYKEASDVVDEAISLNNKLPLLHYERALYAMQLGDTDRATVEYFHVLSQQPQNVKVRLRMCELSSILRERETALKYCGEVTQLAPTWAIGWYKLGREHYLQGNFADAQRTLNRCSTLQIIQDVPVNERIFECWYLQGQAAEYLGDCQALTATYNEFRAMSIEADMSETWTYPPEGPDCVEQSTSGG